MLRAAFVELPSRGALPGALGRAPREPSAWSAAANGSPALDHYRVARRACDRRRRLDAVTLPQIIECLDPRQAAVLKMRFDRGPEPREIRVRLRVSDKRLESPGNRRT